MSEKITYLPYLSDIVPYYDMLKNSKQNDINRMHIIFNSVEYERMMKCKDLDYTNIHYYRVKKNIAKKVSKESKYTFTIREIKSNECECKRKTCNFMYKYITDHLSCTKINCNQCKNIETFENIYGLYLLSSLKDVKNNF